MVIFQENATKIALNKHFSKNCAKLKLTNLLSRTVYTFDNLVDSSDSDFFYELSPVDFSNLEVGTYYIELFDEEDALIETQLGGFGDYDAERTQYKKENKRTIYERN